VEVLPQPPTDSLMLPPCCVLATRLAGAYIGGWLPGSTAGFLTGRPRYASCSRVIRLPGLLAYKDGTVAGWCGLGPRSHIGRLMRSRTIPVIDDLQAWSVTCFVVRPAHRRRGVARARVSTSFAYVGTTSMFEAAGFHRVVQTAAHSASLPRWLMRRTF
jgi:ribosomal protein S18 acetylase RimI-like enzyme